ncbi:MAG: AIM24 family protein, partial [Chloroflexaceae bacterium]|nr:AIM24 family protein [Chloroflexaceae bacterium]
GTRNDVQAALSRDGRTAPGAVFRALHHFLPRPRKMVIDSGMFYASEGSIDIGVAMQQHLSATLVGGESFFQTRLSGTGWCVLCSPVPSNEIIRYQLQNEKLCVDGNFALLRKGNIAFRVERSRRSFRGSLTSGEGLMQTFTGTGEVWIAPTQSVYEYLKQTGIDQGHDHENRSPEPE